MAQLKRNSARASNGRSMRLAFGWEEACGSQSARRDCRLRSTRIEGLRNSALMKTPTRVKNSAQTHSSIVASSAGIFFTQLSEDGERRGGSYGNAKETSHAVASQQLGVARRVAI